jgi:peptide/nickel transport system permease protein
VTRPLALISLAYLGIVLAAAIFAPVLAPYDPLDTDVLNALSGPTGAHLLGTDTLGRDVLSRLMHGGQSSLLGAAQAVLTVLLLGVPCGLLAGYLGGWVDRAVSRVTDVMLAVPVVLMLLVVLAIFGSDQTAAMIALGVLGAPDLARIVRGATFAVRHELYISAAKVAGLPTYLILARHVLPRVAGPVVVQASIFAGGALLTQSALSFLGLGVQPPAPTWGGLVAEGSTVIDQQPWLLVPPGVVIGLAILSFGLIGDAVRDASRERTGVLSPRRARAARAHPESTSESALLSLRSVSVELPTTTGVSEVVDDVTLDVAAGETVGLLGESGCGKSMTGRAILGLLPPGGVTTGRITFDGVDLTSAGQRAMRRLRGSGIALVSQDPIASLDPVFRVGTQLDELVRRHDGGSRKAIRTRTLDLLDQVNLSDVVAERYPHELSGGMAQRVAIAMALAGRPKLLIADEPTTALDVTVQAEILDLLRRIQQDTGMSIVLITHDWGVAADLCHRAYVMYAGQVVEGAAMTELFDTPLHPYSAGLLDSIPRREHRGRALPSVPGTVPGPGDRPAGCRFQPRCPLAAPECGEPIPLLAAESGHDTRCVRHDKLGSGGDCGRTLAGRA